MKYGFASFLLLLSIVGFHCKNRIPFEEIDLSRLKDGDIIFQETNSEQGKAIKLVTESKYTHVGILFHYGSELKVLEAVEPVKITKFSNFFKRGSRNHISVKRLKDNESLLNRTNIDNMKIIGNSFLGKQYDLTFNWSDDKIYCTELVWKVYKRSLNIEVSKLEKMRDFNLDNPFVKKLIKKRYGNNLPLDEPVLSPSGLFESDLFTTVMTVN